MAQSTLRIDIDELRVGMYVQDIFDKNGAFLLSANSKIVNQGQIDRLKARGIKNLQIDVDKGVAPERHDSSVTATSEPRVDTDTRENAYFEEIEAARAIHKESFSVVRHTLKSARMGNRFSAAEVENTAKQLTASISRNPDALASLCQIKGYDEYTFVHSLNVSILVTSLAKELGYKDDHLIQVGIGGLLHDLGKMKVPESVLNKPGKYVDWEFNEMKKHPLYGVEILRAVYPGASQTVYRMVEQHHERYNGSGYPRALKGKQVSEEGLIAAVADVYDALTTDRVYRGAWTPQKALAHIFQGCDEDYSRKIVERFTKHLGIYPVGSFVILKSGEMGVVTRANRGKLMSPFVTVLFDSHGHKLPKSIDYDLSEMQARKGEAYQIQSSANPKKHRVNPADYLGKNES